MKKNSNLKRLMCTVLALATVFTSFSVAFADTLVPKYTGSTPANLGVNAAKYHFQIKGENTYYSVLDTAQNEDDTTKYLLWQETIGVSGKWKNTTPVTQKYDPAEAKTAAYWVDKCFTGQESYTRTDYGIPYTVAVNADLQTHILKNQTWEVEAGAADGPCPQAYTVTASAVLMSYNEYFKYVDKINVTGEILMRSPDAETSSNSVLMAYANGTQNGHVWSVANMSAGYNPVFWLSENFFGEVALNPDTMGEEVKKYIRQKFTRSHFETAGIYSAEELDKLGYAEKDAAAKDVTLLGNLAAGEELVCDWQFEADSNNSPQGTIVYKWYVSDSEDGEFSVISGENNSAYTVKQSDVGKFIKALVTPFDENGTKGISGESGVCGAVKEAQSLSAKITSLAPTGSGDINGATGATANVEVINNTGSTKNLTLFIGLYHSDNTLEKFEVKTVSAPAGTNPFSVELLNISGTGTDYLSAAVAVEGSLCPLAAKSYPKNLTAQTSQKSDVEILHNLDTGIYTVEGSLTEARYNRFVILKVEKIVSENSFEDKYYAVIPTTGAGGFNYSFDLKGEAKKNYRFSVGAYDFGEPYTQKIANLSNDDIEQIKKDINDIVLKYNSATDKTEAEGDLLTYLDADGEAIGCANSYFSTVGGDMKLAAMGMILQKGPFADLETLKEVYLKYTSVAAFSASDASGVENIIAKYGDYIGLDSASTYSLYKAETDKQAMHGRIAGKSIKSDSELLTTFDSAVLLSKIETAQSWGHVLEYFEDYDEFFEPYLSSYSDEQLQAVAQATVGKDFSAMTDFDTAAKDAAEPEEDDNNQGSYTPGYGGGGGGGGGGSKGSVTVKDNTVYVQPQKQQSLYIFADTAEASWAANEINTLYEKGVINGVDEKNFAPNANITREEFVKIIVKAFSLKAASNDSTDTEFDDVPKSHWAHSYIETALSLGIINGISDTEFGLGQNITREDLMVILARTADYVGATFETDKAESAQFADSGEISDYAAEAVETLVLGGFVNGFEDNTIRPKNNTTRAEAAVVLYRLTEAMNL